MERLEEDIISMLYMNDETVPLITEYLNTLVNERETEPYHSESLPLSEAEVEAALIGLSSLGYVEVAYIENDLSLPECHGTWYRLTGMGKRASNRIER